MNRDLPENLFTELEQEFTTETGDTIQQKRAPLAMQQELADSIEYHIALLSRALSIFVLLERHWARSATRKPPQAALDLASFLVTEAPSYFDEHCLRSAQELAQTIHPTNDRDTFFQSYLEIKDTRARKKGAAPKAKAWTLTWSPQTNENQEVDLDKYMENHMNDIVKLTSLLPSLPRFPNSIPGVPPNSLAYLPPQVSGIPSLLVSPMTYYMDDKEFTATLRERVPIALRNTTTFSPNILSSLVQRARYNRYLSDWNGNVDSVSSRAMKTEAFGIMVVLEFPNSHGHFNQRDLASVLLFVPETDRFDTKLSTSPAVFLVDLSGWLTTNQDSYIGRFADISEIDNWTARILEIKNHGNSNTIRVHYAIYVHDTVLETKVFPRYRDFISNFQLSSSDVAGAIQQHGGARIFNKIERIYDFPEYTDFLKRTQKASEQSLEALLNQ